MRGLEPLDYPTLVKFDSYPSVSQPMSYLLSYNTVCKHSSLTYPHASEHIQDTLGNRARFTSIRKPVCYVAPHVDFIELPVEW